VKGEATKTAVINAGLRLDKWLWFARFLKTRSAAQRLIEGGRLRLNGKPSKKAHQSVKPGDVLSFPLGPHVRVIRIKALAVRRGPASETGELYEDLDPPRKPASKPDAPPSSTRDPGAGRPTKRDRRQIDRLRDGT